MELPSERNPPAASCGISERIKQDARDLTFENSLQVGAGSFNLDTGGFLFHAEVLESETEEDGRCRIPLRLPCFWDY